MTGDDPFPHLRPERAACKGRVCANLYGNMAPVSLSTVSTFTEELSLLVLREGMNVFSRFQSENISNSTPILAGPAAGRNSPTQTPGTASRWPKSCKKAAAGSYKRPFLL